MKAGTQLFTISFCRRAYANEQNHSCLKQRICRRVIFFTGMLFILPGLPVRAEDESPVLVDLEPPRITIIRPLDGATITEERPWLEAQISDEDSGVNQYAIVISLNGFDVTAGAVIERMDLQEIGAAKQWRVRYRPPVALPPGQHRVQIDVTDTAGNSIRQQWYFYIQVTKPRVSWDIGLTNTLGYDYLPLEKLQDTANFTSYLQLPGQRFTLQFQTSLTDYPGLITEPNFYGYYLYLDQYAVGWQNKWFAVQHGNVNLPFESGLLYFGLGFKGTAITGSNMSSQTRQWQVFKGTSLSSFGLGLSVMETTGGIYRWQRGTARNQAYFLQAEDRSAGRVKIIGFQDDRVFTRGILRSEIMYGVAKKGGGGLRVQGATELAGVFWSADCILLQASWPLPNLSPLHSPQGGAYQYSIRGDKLFTNEKRLNFSYSHSANNMDGSAERTRRRQSLQMNATGIFAPDFGWLLGYQGGRREEYSKSEQHIIKMGIWQRINESNWNSNLLVENSAANTMRYQWNVGYTKPLPQYGLRTTTLLRYTVEEKTNNRQDNNLRLRITMEKDWFEDLAKSYIVVAYENRYEKDPSGEDYGSEEVILEGSLNFRVTNHNIVKFSGDVSFWKNSRNHYGTDYSLAFLWQARFL